MVPSTALTRHAPGLADAPCRVMLVDDSAVVRSILERIVGDMPAATIAASAASAAAAIDALATTPVDVIVLDIEMPGMNGLAALPHLLRMAPAARVLILSSNCAADGPAAVEALALGASDTLCKPGRGSFAGTFSTVLRERVMALAPAPAPAPGVEPRARARGAAARPAPVAVPEPSPAARPVLPAQPACVAVAASTGGIPAFAALLAAMGEGVAAPILLTQHLPAAFIPYYAQQLAGLTRRRVVVAANGMRLAPGHVYLAPGTGHLTVVPGDAAPAISIDTAPAASGCLPSADPMFAAVARVYGRTAVGVILSGMGRDGADGAALLWASEARIFAQDAATSVVWGMPGAAVRGGAVTAVLPPAQIGEVLAAAVHQPGVRP